MRCAAEPGELLGPRKNHNRTANTAYRWTWNLHSCYRQTMLLAGILASLVDSRRAEKTLRYLHHMVHGLGPNSGTAS